MVPLHSYECACRYALTSAAVGRSSTQQYRAEHAIPCVCIVSNHIHSIQQCRSIVQQSAVVSYDISGTSEGVRVLPDPFLACGGTNLEEREPGVVQLYPVYHITRCIMICVWFFCDDGLDYGR